MESAPSVATTFARDTELRLDKPGDPDDGKIGRVLFEPKPTESFVVVLVGDGATAVAWPVGSCRPAQHREIRTEVRSTP